MAITISFVEVVLIGTALYFLYNFLKKKRDPRYPPGKKSIFPVITSPSPSYALPIIGNLLQLGSQPQKVFLKWAEQYGDVFSFKMGSNDVIMLNEPKIIKDVFGEGSSAGRTPNPMFLALANGNYGIIVGEGVHWEQQRRFTLRTLRDLGFAKTSMEGIILDEINYMIKFFEKRLDKPISGNRIFNGPVVNALWNIISGERHDWDGLKRPEILEQSENLINTLNRANETGLFFAPALRHIAPDYFGWTKWIDSIANIMKICDQSITRHIKKLNPDSPQDLIDHYLIEMNKETDPSSSFYKETGEKNLTAVIPDLFLAGSETTSHTLSWIMAHLAHHQTVLKKLQQELDTVVGTSRQPSVSDRPKYDVLCVMMKWSTVFNFQSLPYMEATTMEILRRTSIANLGVPHRMLQDAVINGYFFPKNATIISNIYKVHNDPKIWNDPEDFRPERFLSIDGTKVVRHDALIPFSAGKRQCPGESLAKDTLFLFLACIVQKFDIKAGSSTLPEVLKNVEPKNKMVNEPDNFKIIVSLRKL